jgi:basic amino acid/polyamine antiporter, APA family
MTEEKTPLVRGLTSTHTTLLVIGTVIGSGVFLKSAVMAQEVGSPALVLAAWIAAGLLSLAGALTYAELGALLPQAGGEYVYLRRAYGEAPAFLFGWMRFSVASAGAIAVLGIAFATFLSALWPLTSVWAERTYTLLGQEIHWQLGTKQLVAVLAILFFSAVNCVGVVFGGRVQSILTLLKVLGIAVVVLGVFLLSETANRGNLRVSSGSARTIGVSAFGAAMLAALWAYDGWNTMPMVAGEVRHPERNVPRALIGGMLAVMTIYCLTNLAYFYALPFAEVATANSTSHRDALPVATKAAQTFLGSFGGRLISIAFILSVLGALNGLILSSARVPFAMARDGLFFSRFSAVSSGSRVPVWSIVIQAMWSSVLALSGSYDQLTDYVIFASWIFYGMTTSAVFVLRRKLPDMPRPYKTLGYPVIPLIFVLVALWLVINTLLARPVESVTGLALMSVGLPIFIYYRHRRRRKTTSD